MEIRQNMRRATTRPDAWVVAVVVALALGVISWYALTTSALTHTTSAGKPPATTVNSLLDRAAERQQQGSISRDGGPGGQIGDAP
jgi:cytoskeletal protein RodZ